MAESGDNEAAGGHGAGGTGAGPSVRAGVTAGATRLTDAASNLNPQSCQC